MDSCITGKIDALIAEQRRLVAAVRQLEQRLDQLSTPPQGFTQGQHDVFGALSKISGNDTTARKKADRLLKQLVGTPTTEVNTKALQLLLNDHGWAIALPNRRLGTPIWKKEKHCQRGGRLAVYFRDTNGRTRFPIGGTKFPPLTLARR